MKHYDEYIIQLIQLYLVGDLSGEEKVKLESGLLKILRERSFLKRFVMKRVSPPILVFTRGE